MNNSDNNDRPERDLQSIQEKICNYILSNPLSVLSATSLLVGGIIFWLYFSDIQYFPDLDFNKSVLFLLVAAITGVTTILILTFLIMSPYIIRWWIPLEQQNHSALSSDEEKFSDRERIWYFLSIFIVYFVFFLHFFLKSYVKTAWITYGIPCFIGLVVMTVHLIIYWKGVWWERSLVERSLVERSLVKKVWKWKKLEGKADKSMIGIWFFSTFMMLMVLAIIINPIVVNIDSNEYISFLGLLLIILGGNLSFAFFREKKIEEKKTGWYWFIPILTVLSIFSMAQNTYIPKFVMNKYKFGNFETQQLLVDEDGCKFLKNLELIPNPIENNNTCNVQNIKILSRLGSFFYIESICKPPWLCTPIRFTIPTNKIS